MAKVLSWIFSVLFLLFGVVGIMNEPLAGLMLFLIGVVVLPPFTTFLSRVFNYTPSWIVKWIAIFVLYILFTLVAEPINQDNINNFKTTFAPAAVITVKI